MADVRLLIQEEGRAARNLIAFNVPMGTSSNTERVTRKPPSIPRSINSSMKRNMKSTTRVRSASTGRDKKSELQARYWAFLFGNLQRAVDGIYQTCEEDENISECKEVILVLENYTRDFHNLIEWFKVKWAYENSPPPLRRTPLAWEVRKTSPCRMWNSSVATKCCSPTCRSPDDTIIENKISANDKNRDVLNPSDHKRLKDNRNVSKKDPKYFQNKMNNKNSIVGTRDSDKSSLTKATTRAPVKIITTRANTSVSISRKIGLNEINSRDLKNTNANKEHGADVKNIDSKIATGNISEVEKIKNKTNVVQPSYSSLTRTPRSTRTTSQSQSPEFPKMIRSKTTLSVREVSSSVNKVRPGSSVMMRKRQPEIKIHPQPQEPRNIRGSVEVLTKGSTNKSRQTSEDSDGWQTVRSRCRRGSSHSLNMSTRFHRPTTATSLPALSMESCNDINKTASAVLIESGEIFTDKINILNGEEHITKLDGDKLECNKMSNSFNQTNCQDNDFRMESISHTNVSSETTSTLMIAAIFKNEAELLEKKIQQFMTAQAERERIILEEERKTEEADSQRCQQLSDEEASLQRQIQELESTEIDIDTETDETDGEMALEIEEDRNLLLQSDTIDDISLEDRYENMLEGMSWAERVDTLAQLKALVARHPGRALELHQKLSSPSRKRSLPEALRRYQAKQACAEHKRQTLLSEKSQRLRELLNKVEEVKKAKNQLTEDKRVRMEMKLKRAEENRTQHLLEVVRKAHDEDSKLKEIAFINELEAQNKRHDFMALCQEQEERLQGIQEERQRRQEEKAAKEAAAEERRRALEAERQLRIQKMRQVRREREERVGKMQLEREKERQELAREKARDREERLSALHAAQLANQEELQKKIAHKQQESARRHVENIEHIRQRAVESSILRNEEIPPTLKCYPAPKQCSLCGIRIPNEINLLSHLKGKNHLEAVKKMHDSKEPSRDELQRFNIAQIKDLPGTNVNGGQDKIAKEKQKALKRRARKLKQKMTAKGQEWENSQNEISQFVESPNKTKFRRNLKELDRLSCNHGKNTWSSVAVAGLERGLGEITRAFNKAILQDQDVFRSLAGFETLTNLLNLGLNNVQTSSIQAFPNKSIVSVCRVYKLAINSHTLNREYILLSNKISVILDLVLQRFEAVVNLDDLAQQQETSGGTNGNGSVTIAVLQLLCNLIPEEPFEKTILQSRISDITGFLVTGGIIDRISCHNSALIETDYYLDQEHESQLLLTSYDLLYRLCLHLKRPTNDNSNSPHDIDQTTGDSHLLGCLHSSEAAGAIGCLYSTFALAHLKCSSPTTGQSNSTSFGRLLAQRGLKLLRTIGQVDLQMLQSILGAEGTSLQWRLIASHLITRFQKEPLVDANDSSSSQTAVTILMELFTVLGYFAVNNIDNQLVLQTAGAGPSVLQHLCTLPFPFYGDPRLAPFTLPTLLAATHGNPDATAVLSCEMSYQLLEEYKNSEAGQQHPLIRLLKEDSPHR